ncbi:DUF1588 domain-containing protein [Stieleria sp. TO1_6]|uniref:DUF1588 domain-containing protein n=1 Tax=Stieleria tagensis TaxID=2956795 RepID=UPI00209B3B42|nr:DUF1588 domain-containing protein [Stieleria tagensis]MCO8124542.1 DUF1588 domain-containing protein [Stieleria tagensis]
MKNRIAVLQKFGLVVVVLDLAKDPCTAGSLTRSTSAWSLLIALLVFSLSVSAPLRAEAPPQVATFIENHCLDCHSGDGSERGFDLDGLSFDLADTNSHDKWVRAFDRVRTGQMPPADAEKPEQPDVDAFLKTLQPTLISAEQDRIAKEGRSTVRRLSRAEHINALRDLLKMPLLDAGDKLPPDPLSDGFGKSSSTLPFSHVQVDRYLEVADDALRAAMAPQREKPVSKKTSVWIKDLCGQTIVLDKGKPKEQATLRLIREAQDVYLEFKHGSALPLIGRKRDLTFESHPGNFQTKKHGYVLDQKPYIDAIGIVSNAPLKIGRASQAGRYTIRIDAFAFQANKGTVEPTERTEVIAVYGDTSLLGTFDISANDGLQFLEVELKAGETISIAMATLPLWRIEVGGKQAKYLAVDVPAVAIKGFEIEGPFVDAWPPESHRRLFGDLTLQPRGVDRVQEPSARGSSTRSTVIGSMDYEIVSEDPSKDARRLLSSFMNEAYRRDISPLDFEIPMGMFQRRLESGASFQAAMISAYSSVLSSPSFVLVEMHAGELPPPELANRLALFLWNAPADGQLRRSLNTALKADRYLAFVDEMLVDPRSTRFVDHFLDHWLNLRDIGVTEPDENLYHGYSTWTLESMLMETRAFFREMILQYLPIRNVVDSNFLMLNGELAELYGIEGPAGATVTRVAIAENSIRGGFLTQASVLKVSANGTTTSPVIRGVYVMDRLLGDPPPPPPEAVAAVEPDISGVTTIREQLARHRADPSCASCHRKIDPPGFALESFDVMGRFRERYHSLEKGKPVEGINRRAKPIKFKLGLSVDSSGQMEDGRPFDGIEQFRRNIVKDERAIARNLLERLVVYATGHPVGISDRPHIETILDATADDGYRLRSVIHGLVQSSLFRNK